MNVLWITNTLFPEAQSLLKGNKGIINGSGGWLSASADALMALDDFKLGVVAINKQVEHLTRLEGNKCVYYIIPLGKGNIKYNKEYIPFWQNINKDFKPDVIHLHGTEFSHGLSLLEALPNARIVISIQGLISRIQAYYNQGMTYKDIWSNITLRDVMHSILRYKSMDGTLFQKKKNFEIRGYYEQLIIKRAKAVIGRTKWDQANVLAINPNLEYYFCNETLRPEFYEGKWRYDNCEPHTIFLSQASFPFKGLHMVLKAMPIILRDFPDTKIIVAGNDILGDNSFKSRLLQPGYTKYIKNLMKKLHIDRSQVIFKGPLDANGMKEQYLKSNVFVSPSGIENSPNSVCEAQMLGVPIIASYVGGTSDMIPNDRCGYLYRFEDYELLAALVKKVFDESLYFDGNIEMSIAHSRHDININLNTLITIYNNILSTN